MTLSLSEKDRVAHINLHEFGGHWRNWPILHGVALQGLLMDTLTFSGKDRLVVAYVIKENEAVRMGPRKVIALVVDHAGSILGRGEWLIPIDEGKVLSAKNGNFIVQTKDKLTLYSSDKNFLQEVSLSRNAKLVRDDWEVLVTPSRNSIVLEHFWDGKLELTWLDPDSLQPRRSLMMPGGMIAPPIQLDPPDIKRWKRAKRSSPHVASFKNIQQVDAKRTVLDDSTLPRAMNGPSGRVFTDLAVSDDNIAITVRDQGPDTGRINLDPNTMPNRDCKILTSSDGRAWRTVYHVNDPICGDIAQFIGNDTLYFCHSQGKNKVYFMRADGTILVQEPLGAHEEGYGARAAWDGSRFAVPVIYQKGGLTVFDTGPKVTFERIDVYDAVQRKVIASLNKKSADLQNLRGFALSPDGTELAILNDATVDIFRLPPPYSQPVPK